MRRSVSLLCAAALGATALSVSVPANAAPPDNAGTNRAAAVAAYWTAEERAAAQPRDLLLDERGLAYTRDASGGLTPYGHTTPPAPTQLRAETTARPVEQGKPSGGGGTGDTTAPAVTNRSPSAGATTGTSVPFSATVTDDSGVRSVNVVVTYPNGTQTSSFAAARNGTTWSVTVSGFSGGNWQWHVVAKDGAKPANTTTTDKTSFTVGTAPPPTDGVVTNARWTDAGAAVKKAAGRIYFEMPAPTRRSPGAWAGYVCSGTAVTDSTSNDVSVILTAAHCVYDDANKKFARNVLFIPGQDDGGADGTDRICTNDPIGCWAPSHGVVDTSWTTHTFPANVEWDYAYYVVPTGGAHSPGTAEGTDETLEVAAGSLNQNFSPPTTGDPTTALGYSYDYDPNFMYCKEDLTALDAVNWWLPSCGLSGGSSGGPWVQPMSNGSGPVISVNSWGYTNQPGMAGPKLSGTTAQHLFNAAQITTSSGSAIVGQIATA